jgi:hypothetical protein
MNVKAKYNIVLRASTGGQICPFCLLGRGASSEAPRRFICPWSSFAWCGDNNVRVEEEENSKELVVIVVENSLFRSVLFVSFSV